ncbi:M28 family peptidase [Kordiimonas sp.]|uniref:M28 family peptidase n=1 Tax=Kordiimonas sp. TaxID=1970157 RepID=UPI003A92BD7A
MQKLALGLLVALSCLPKTANADSGAVCRPNPATLSAITRELASDDFGGRAPSSQGEPLVIDLISKAFKGAGLSPAGDMIDGEQQWTQRVALVRSSIDGPVSITLNAGDARTPLTQGKEIVFRATKPGTSEVDIKSAPVVFVGYGVSAPERDWDDFKGVDLKGKIALILVNDPDHLDTEGPFGGNTMTYYGRWTYKLEEATRRGALGALIVHETKAASYDWPIVRNSNMAEVFDIPTDASVHQLSASGWVQHDLAERLAHDAGLELKTLEEQARRRDFRPVELSGVSLDVEYSSVHEETVSHNIIGVLPGSKRPDEYLVHSAHWDHIGQRIASDGTVHIYNGAQDNAVGVAALLKLAKCYGEAGAAERSVIFLATTAEEQGLFGAGYYVEHPPYALKDTVGLINFDILGVNGPSRNVSTFGYPGNSLTDLLKTTAQQHGLYFSPDPKPEAGHYYRSETLPFARAGIPAITFTSGDDLIDGGVSAGRQAAADYIAQRYHQPGDVWSPNMNFEGIAENVALVYAMGYRLAMSEDRPYWYKDSEFGNEKK